MANERLELKEVGSDRTPHVEEMPDTRECLIDDVSKDVRTGFTMNDQRDMHRMGKKQELRRNFRLISTIGFTTCIMGTWENVLTSTSQGLRTGGRPCLFWSLVWAYCGQLFIVLSLAEMSSMAPTAGGQYHWVSEFAPRKYQRFLSYASGWLSALAWQSVVAFDTYLTGTMIQGMIFLNNETYVPARWQGTLIVSAASIGMSLFNIFAAKHLPLAEGIFVTFHFFAFAPIIVTLLVLAPKAKAQDVFFGFKDYGAEWANPSLAVMIGQVSQMFTVMGSDSVAHMSEEIENAGATVPQSMILSFFLNMPFAIGSVLTYLFIMPNVQEALDSPTGLPFIHVFSEATKNATGASILLVVILLLFFMITISCIASASRQTFAFARDNGLPFSAWLGAVHPTLHIPVNSVIITCAFSLIMFLINIGSGVAMNALLSLSTSPLMATYMISIACVIVRRITKSPPLPPSRWSLGRFGMPINILALVYALWAFFWSFWPVNREVTAETLNWAPVLFVGVMGLSAVLYWLVARKVYEGPVVKVEGRKFH
ncbi:amino acid transporter [Aspergillus nomiae NRRL 13137]|uniref:Amino acid transporter n=1 Tax=Aspergillus nomiae NRRL (strain ATCC 15546 / NRRL 13137 / CBS 260.88 / M93) TaxID=1509407 RepID=A0A0L1IZG1_ASPN3|nr:amino acid transporter [Aspergillus nomiae NRRL 13137]KNG84805.1 amino acid transporter [Aspergillus nomiae NRRL 13137]